MKEKNKYTMTFPRKGLTQYKFEGHSWTLSVGSDESIHYCSNHEGTVEIAVKNEHGKLISLSAYDTVQGYVSMQVVENFIEALENKHSPWACHKFFHHYFEPVQA